MITTVIVFINCFIAMFTGHGFIVSPDSAFCAGMFEMMITIGIAGIYNLWKGM